MSEDGTMSTTMQFFCVLKSIMHLYSSVDKRYRISAAVKMKSERSICIGLSPLNVTMQNLVKVFDENVTTMKPCKTSLL